MKIQPRDARKQEPREVVRTIRRALNGNAHCVFGRLFRNRVVATQHGGLSHEYLWGLSTK